MSARHAIGTAILVLPLAMPALGHHGWSANADEVSISGEVVGELSLAGPHGTLQIRADDGQIWEATLAPAPRTHRAGLREGMLAAGDAVTVYGERNADPATFELKVRRVTWNERHFDVYPPRN